MMRKSCFCILAAAVFMLESAICVQAKVYWMPDYFPKDVNRSYGANTPTRPSQPTRPTKPIIPADPCAALTDHDCGSLDCAVYYSNCSSKCQTCYTDNCHKYTDQNCGSLECAVYYNDCTSKCKTCYSDNCHNRENNVINEEWGCRTYWDDCKTKCKDPYTDNCHNRPDNKTDYGCLKNWNDCVDKCETGKPCTPKDCSGFTLTTAPANASYSSCTPGCDSNDTKYKIDFCNDGYTLNGNSCVKEETPITCAGGYDLLDDDTRSACIENNGYIELQSGQSSCFRCMQCGEDYTSVDNSDLREECLDNGERVIYQSGTNEKCYQCFSCGSDYDVYAPDNDSYQSAKSLCTECNGYLSSRGKSQYRCRICGSGSYPVENGCMTPSDNESDDDNDDPEDIDGDDDGDACSDDPDDPACYFRDPSDITNINEQGGYNANGNF